MGFRLSTRVWLFISFLPFTVMNANAQLGPLGQQIKSIAYSCHEVTKGGNENPPLLFNMQLIENKRVLLISGEFEVGASVRLQQYLSKGIVVDEVWFDSPGGIAAEGPKVGRVIRAARLSTRVASGYSCASSCTLAFLGGVVRKIDIGASYGVHTFFHSGNYDDIETRRKTKDRNDPTLGDRLARDYIHKREQSNALLAADWQVFISQMGVSRDFLTSVVLKQNSLVFYTDKEIAKLREKYTDESISELLQTIRCPSRETLLRYNVINVRG